MNITEILGGFTSKITASVTGKAKDTAISTLKDPEVKAAASQFAKDFFQENKIVITAVVGSFLLLSVLAIFNIISNFSARR